MTHSIKRDHTHNSPEINSGRKFLTFTLGDEQWAIDILKVQEIKGSESSIKITSIPDVPPHIKGIFYLHDMIVPIVDLRIFYHIKPTECEQLKAIIVLNTKQSLLGIVVDAVLDIVEITTDQIKPAPEFSTLTHHHYIEGIGSVNDKLLIILDVEKLIFSEELKISTETKSFS